MKLIRTPLGTLHPKRAWMAGNGQSQFGVSACVTVAKVTFSANATKTPGLEVRVIKSGRGTTPHPCCEHSEVSDMLVSFLSLALGHGLANSEHRKDRQGQVHSDETSPSRGWRTVCFLLHWMQANSDIFLGLEGEQNHGALSQREGLGFWNKIFRMDAKGFHSDLGNQELD